MGATSDRLLQLRPVTFRYKEAHENGAMPLEYGLIAEEVAEAFPDLVVFNAEGQPETVKYRLLSSLLLNEVKKQHGVNQLAAMCEMPGYVDCLWPIGRRAARRQTLTNSVP